MSPLIPHFSFSFFVQWLSQHACCFSMSYTWLLISTVPFLEESMSPCLHVVAETLHVGNTGDRVSYSCGTHSCKLTAYKCNLWAPCFPAFSIIYLPKATYVFPLRFSTCYSYVPQGFISAKYYYSPFILLPAVERRWPGALFNQGRVKEINFFSPVSSGAWLNLLFVSH